MTRRLRVHVLLGAGFLLLFGSMSRAGTSFSPDEGSYGLQALALEDGSWTYEAASESIDPDGVYFPLASASEIEPGVHVPHGRNPTFVQLVRLTRSAFGTGGWIMVLPAVGTLVAAAGAWMLARRIHPGSEAYAFWLTVVSPLTFNGFVLWGHSLAAACSVWATYGVVLGMDRRGRSAILPWASAALAVAGGVLVRSEGVVFAAALPAVVGLVGIARRSAASVTGAASVAAAGAIALLLDRAWTRSIVGGVSLSVRDGGTLGEYPYLRGRWEGLIRAVFGGGIYDSGAILFGRLTLIVGVIALVAAWRGVNARIVWVLVALTCGAVAARIVAAPTDPLNGLAVAWPAGAVVAISLRALAAKDRLVVAIVAVFTVCVVVTQYADGGALQWGGRFLQPTIPLVAAVVGGLLARSGAAVRMRVLAVGPISAALLVASLMCLRTTREQHERLYDAVRAEDAPINLALPGVVPRSMWRDPEVAWLDVSPRNLQGALRLVERAGLDQATLIWFGGVPLDAGAWSVDLVGRFEYDSFPFDLYRLRH